MRVALVSLNQAWEDKEANKNACRAFVKTAKEQSAGLVVFPEMTLTSFSMNVKSTAEDGRESETVEFFQKLSAEFKIAVVFGVVFRDGQKATNNCVMLDPNGAVVGTYAKIHPFSFAGEDKVFSGGEKICFSRIGDMTVGLTVCYDLRFPEIYGALAKNCELIINIANWPAKRIDHWNALLKARAIENQIFVAGVNRVGTDGNGLEYVKSTQIINPNGEKLSPIMTDGELDVFDVDAGRVSEFKKTFSTTQDRNPSLYKTFF
ncbi:MAG: carbon-nitrogen family hydrolase [Nitrospinae bacterium]|nr:carbon-nitrogen family hydrolase [Nitrospinota bacterium]